jgi:hypothetical protein
MLPTVLRQRISEEHFHRQLHQPLVLVAVVVLKAFKFAKLSCPGLLKSTGLVRLKASARTSSWLRSVNANRFRRDASRFLSDGPRFSKTGAAR